MRIILQNWISSLSLLKPTNFLVFCKQSSVLFGAAIVQLFANFGWLIGIHVTLFYIFGELVAKIITNQGGITKAAPPGLSLITLVQSVLWFLIASAFLLIIRKNYSLDVKTYFRLFFFKYIQLLFAVSLVIFIGLYLLILGGITKIPATPWAFAMIVKTIELGMVFYWLDSRFEFINLFTSLERTINFIFYNAPFIAFLLGLLWSFDYGLGLLASKTMHIKHTHLLFSQPLASTATGNLAHFFVLKALVFKYITLVFEHLWICFIFILYRQKRNFYYSPSIFEKSCEPNS